MRHPTTCHPEELAESLGSSLLSGLCEREIASKLSEFGLNSFIKENKLTFLKIFWNQIANPMIILLIAVVFISLILGHVLDAAVIATILVINIALGAFQEHKAEKQMQSIRNLAAPKAKVIRNQNTKTILASEIVPGDLIVLEAGDLVPADARLIHAEQLRTDESRLTGESTTVDKTAKKVFATIPNLAEQSNIVFAGTSITKGRATAICFATGEKTEIGKIVSLLHESTGGETALQKRVQKLTKTLVLIASFICVTIFVTGYIQGQPALKMLLAAVSLAIASIPEGLPAVITISLALGAKRLASKNVLVRQLIGVEGLGSITTICTDKTGTLTQNLMALKSYEIKAPEQEDLFWQAITLCNDAKRSQDSETFGDPTEIALLEAAETKQHNKTKLEKDYQRIGEYPFDSERKRMSTVHQHRKQIILYCKGAPEAILEVCDFTNSSQKEIWSQKANHLAEQGFRVLAVASKQLNTFEQDNTNKEESQLQFLGLIALTDPPRPESKEAIAACRRAGIRPIMMTGDHEVTAKAIGNELGIPEQDIHWRVSPAEKLQLVKELQESGEIVAMTGDGVNDGPALKASNVGVAMGRGTDVAKEASDLILVKEDFATIVAAIREGRIIFDNIKKFIKYMLTTNLGEVTTMFFCLLLNLPLPLTALQILWINLVTDGLPAVALGYQPAEDNVLQRPPRPPQETIFSQGLGRHVFVIGTLMGFSMAVLFYFCVNKLPLQKSQTIIFTSLTLAQMAHVFLIQADTKAFWKISPFTNWRLSIAILITCVLQLVLIYTNFGNHLFKTTTLSVLELGYCLAVTLFVALIIEIEKILRKRFSKPRMV